MATTLTSPQSGELTYVSIPISKWARNEDGDLVVSGVATDGSVDRDHQIVEPSWSAESLKSWLDTGGNVRMSHDPHRPVGKGLQVEIDRDGDGKHWVKSLIVDPTAQRLVEKGVLQAYSIGIARPVIKRDPTGKAQGGIICGGEICELSIVDRPSNKNAYLEIAKAADDGTARFTGKMFGDEAFIAKAANDVIAEAVTEDVPASSVFSPADMAKLAAKKAELEKAHPEPTVEPEDVVAKVVGDGRFADAVVDRLAAALKGDVEKRQMDPDVGGGVDRDAIPAEDFAGKNRSYPIVTPKDVADAASSIGRAGSDNFSADQLKQNIIAIAKRKGPQFVAQLPQSWQGKDAAPEATKGAKDCTNCGRTYHADSKQRLCEDCGADLPNADDAAKTTTADIKKGKRMCVKCGVKAKKSASFCSNCGSSLDTPNGDVDKGATPGDGVKDKDTAPVPAHREPDGSAMEIFENDAGLQDGDDADEGTDEPAPTWAKSVDYDLARLHDALCAAYHPDVIADTYPTLKSIAHAVDPQVWQDEAQKLIRDGHLHAGQRAVQAASAAKQIAVAHPAALADARAALHKSFADLNPGVGPALSPTTMTPGKFKRPYISSGHAPLSASDSGSQRPGPTAHRVSADDFTRPYLTAGHADPSPAAKADNSPSHGGAPAYAAAQAAAAQNAMKELHDHIAGRHERLCPMDPADHGQAATVGGGDTEVIHPAATKATAATQSSERERGPRYLTEEEAAALTKTHLAGLASLETVEKMLTDRLAERDATIAGLRKELDELASQPDPNLAPIRGVIATKSTSGGGAVDRRSLIDEAMQQERAEKISYLETLTKSGHPVLADQARSELDRILNLSPSEPTAP